MDARDEIAIVGMSCAFPGGVDSPESFWRVLVDEADCLEKPPARRKWNALGGLALSGKYNNRYRGGFISTGEFFDCSFFGISPREAEAMDPQQRAILEASWSALEDANIDPNTLAGSDTGVYIGAMGSDYRNLSTDIVGTKSAYKLTNGEGSVTSGRVAYSLGLLGPAITIDSACSAALVGIHLASASLLSGECSLALVGGVTILSTPQIANVFLRQGAIAPDGRCKAFAAAADGTGLSDGVGVVVVERLSDARRLGHRVLGVVRGSAVNQDGASNGLTAPNGPSQERVIRQALENAGLAASDVDVVEAHGTGTTLGDPIEAQALLATYGQGRDRPLWLGSLKSNIGHTQAAAGVAGLIKMVLAMRHGVLPRTLHVDEPSPHVDWSSGSVELLTEAREWVPGEGGVRRAGVSSFGISGTNAHVILEEAPAVEVEAVGPSRELAVVPWVLSAKSESALAAQAARLFDRVTADAGVSALDVGLSLTARSVFDHRAVVCGGDRDALVEGVRALARGEQVPGVVTGRASHGGAVFVFPGQGSQWVGMAVDLWDSSPVFARWMVACEEAFAGLVDWSLADVLRGGSLERVDVVQPALFAVMVSLAELWRSHGVEPAAVIGHSQGEIAAACCAGVLSLEDAARIVVLRSQALAELSGRGGMVSVAEPVDAVEERIAGWGSRLGVAAENGPQSTVISGDRQALDEFVAACDEAGVWAKRVPVDYASHSAAVDAVRGRLLEGLAGIEARAGAVPVWSTVTGGWLDGSEMTAGYWFDNLRERVRFRDGIAQLLEAGHTAFIESSAHPVLTTAVEDAVDVVEAEVTVLGSLRKNEDGPAQFLTALSQAHCAGITVDWARAFDGTGARRVDLPTYAFQRQRYWLEPPAEGRSHGGAEGELSHPLLTRRIFVPGQPSKEVFEGRFDLSGFAWMLDHKVRDEHILPGAVWLDLVMTVGRAVKSSRVETLDVVRPMSLTPSDSVEFVITCTPDTTSSSHTVEVYAKTAPDDGDSGWSLYCEGTLREGQPDAAAITERHDTTPLPVDEFYARLDRMGYQYGPHFREVRQLSTLPGAVRATVGGADAPGGAELYTVYPPYLDAVLQTSTLTEVFGEDTAARVPHRFEDWGIPSYCDSPIAVETRQVDAETFAVTLLGADGNSASFGGRVRTRELSSSGSQTSHEGIFTLRYLPQGDSPVDEIAAVADRLKSVDTTVDGGTIVIDCPVVTDDVLDLSLPTEVAHRLQEILADPAHEESSLCVRLVHPRATPYEAPRFTELPLAAVRGLVRSAMAEYPGRIALTSCDQAAVGTPYRTTPHSESRFDAGEPHRLTLQALGAQSLKIDVFEDSGWSVEPGERRDCTSFTVKAKGRDGIDIGPRDVLISVRAAGVNFRDSLISMDAYPDKDACLGSEAAGVVVRVGDEVDGIANGDRVAGFFSSSFSQYAKADERLVTKIPDGWSFAQAAAVPVTYCTAYYGLVDLAHAQPGESVLVHSAAGGVGKAAVDIGGMIGLEIYATASPAKWQLLAESGIPGERIASSRTVDFGEQFRAARGGDLDIAIGALAGELNDVTFGLLGESGRMVDMGKLDLREEWLTDPRYLPFDLFDAGVDRVGGILREVFGLLASGALGRPVFRGHDVRSLPSLMPQIRDGKTVGKQVLVVPRRLDGQSTVLVTGGLGNAGSAIAAHLVQQYGIRRLVLTTRSNATSSRAEDVRAKLTALGARIEIRQCDVSDAGAVTRLVEELTAGGELAGVVHCAGATADRTFDTIDTASFDGVFGVKAAGAWHLHQALGSYDLSFFVLFSSIAAALGTAGQANYAAANSFVDGLTEARVAAGLPGLSIAWGLWADRSGLTDRMSDVDRARLARLGIGSVTREAALEMFDDALAQGLPNVIAGRFGFDDASSNTDGVHPVIQTLFGPVRKGGDTVRAVEENGPEQRRTSAAPQPLDAVLGEVARLLGYGSARGIDPDWKFQQLGLDSLSAVELRNGLRRVLSVNVPTTAIFDHPTPRKLAWFLEGQLAPAPQENLSDVFRVLERELAGMDSAELGDALREIRDSGTAAGQSVERVLAQLGSVRIEGGEPEVVVDELDDDELMRIIDNDL